MAPTPELADAVVHDATSPMNDASQKARRNSIAEGLQLPTLDPAQQTSFGSSKRRRSGNEDECDEFGRVDSSKRRRSSNWPLTNQQQEPGSPDSQHSRKARESYLRRHMGSPTRMSKFQEASMHDRASDKPPSFFTRFTKRPANMPTSVDHLMEDYHTTQTAPGPRGPSRGSSHQRAQSISSGYTNNTAAREAAAKDAGVFKFGRSIASNFNPVNIWHKLNQKWQEARQEMMEEDLDEQTRQVLRQRAARAEEQYAKLKAAGQLGKQGSYGIPTGTYVYTPGYDGHAAPADRQRDSGISGIDPHQHVSTTARPYSQKEASKSAAHLLSSPPPAGETTRKSALHFRTPSFANLKRARSEAHLGQKRLPPPPSSPAAHHHHDAAFRGEEEGHGPTLPPSTPNSTLRRSASKRDLQKQLKLSKRVSDLELKLKDARCELYRALGDSSPPPPMPAVPSHLAATLSSTSLSNTANTTRPRVSPLKKKISDLTGRRLPTVPSGQLLSPEQADTREDLALPSSPPPMGVPPPDVTERDEEDQDELTHDNFSTNTTPHLDAPTTTTADIWTAQVASPALAQNKLAKQPKKRGRPPKKRKPGEDGDAASKPPPQTWKPLPRPGGDEREGDEAEVEVDPPKRKRGRPRKTPLPASNNENADPKQKGKAAATTPMTVRSSFTSSQTTLTIPLKDAPQISTASHMTPALRKSTSKVGDEQDMDNSAEQRNEDASKKETAAAVPEVIVDGGAAKRVDSGSGARNSVVSVGPGVGGLGKGEWAIEDRERPKSAMARAGGDDDAAQTGTLRKTRQRQQLTNKRRSFEWPDDVF
ncbi:hypothetical protein IWZ01DRAFT_482304 [Phyllosticta capitalensis]